MYSGGNNAREQSGPVRYKKRGERKRNAFEECFFWPKIIYRITLGTSNLFFYYSNLQAAQEHADAMKNLMETIYRDWVILFYKQT